MREYLVSYGQSIFDIAVNEYGDITRVWDLIDDNAFSEGLDTTLNGGEIILLRDGTALTANTITGYFDRYPATINNSDLESTGLVEALSLVLKQIGNENYGSDGFILIDVNGGTPDYFFEWKLEGNDDIIATTQNLVARSAGTYSVTCMDANGNQATLTNLVISLVDHTVYIVDEHGNNIVDENGNYIIE
ncbi:hypothetical protein WBG78_28425 [Chryseolinea sp. T2]|uniref:hypothetical protein n=1 Tax=Chryseolinea sp. T2 TaxID=3129255 RepID=UPI003077F886